MRIWQLGGHKEFEVFIVVDVAISESDLHNTRIRLELLLKENRVNSWIYMFFQILYQAWPSISDSCRHISKEIVTAEFENEEIVVFLHVFDPFIRLLLWVNAESISFGDHGQDTVFA